MDNEQYNELLANLSQADHVVKPPPVIEQRVNDVKEYLKNGLESNGNFLLGHSGVKTAEGLIKGKLSGGLISKEDADELLEAIKGGDFKKVVEKSIDLGTKNARGKFESTLKRSYDNLEPGEAQGLSFKDVLSKAKSDLTQKVQSLKGRVKAEPPTETQPYYSVDNPAFEPFKEDVPPLQPQFNEEANSILNNTRQSLQESTGLGDDLIQSAPKSITRTFERAGGDMSDELTAGEDAVKALRTATEISAGEDFDPLNIIATGALGLASVIGGLFVKEKKFVNVAPPAPITPNVSVQVGI